MTQEAGFDAKIFQDKVYDYCHANKELLKLAPWQHIQQQIVNNGAKQVNVASNEAKQVNDARGGGPMHGNQGSAKPGVECNSAPGAPKPELLS